MIYIYDYNKKLFKMLICIIYFKIIKIISLQFFQNYYKKNVK